MARGLGKGLDSLIAPVAEPAKKKEAPVEAPKKDGADFGVMVKITKVEPDRDQPRKTFNEDSISELADSIKLHGIIEPLVVQDRGDYYEIVSGERRWRAAKMAGLKEVPVIIKHFTEKEKVEIALIENIQREDLNPIEEAQAYKKLMTEFNMKQDEVAERVSKSRSAVTNSMRLLKLSEDVQQMVIEELITTGHARALLAINDPKEQYAIAQRVLDENLSVRDVEKIVKNMGKAPKPKKETKTKPIDLIYQEIAETLQQVLSTKVEVSGKGEGGGKIEIEFYSHEDLERLVEQISK